MVTQYGALFLNSSFGFPEVPAVDLPSGGPNYPIATPFLRMRYRATDAFTLTGAVYNGDPAPPGTGDPQLRDRHGTAFRLNDHTLSFAELWYWTDQSAPARGLPGVYKLGAWYSSSHFADQWHDTTGRSLADPTNTGIARNRSGDFAVYGIADQMIWRRPGTDDQGIGVFLQVMGAPVDLTSATCSSRAVSTGKDWSAAGRSTPSALAYLISGSALRFGSSAQTSSTLPDQGCRSEATRRCWRLPICFRRRHGGRCGRRADSSSTRVPGFRAPPAATR